MNLSFWKKTAAWGLALAMTMSLTACGGSKGSNAGSDSSKKTEGETKNMVFSGENIDMKDVKGDAGNFIIADDKIYFLSTEWIDLSGNGENGEENSSADSAEDNVPEEGSTEETASEETTSEETDTEGTSAEDETSKESDTEDTGETSADDTDTEEASSQEDVQEEDNSSEHDEDNYEYEVNNRVYCMNFDGTGITEVCQPVLDNKDEYIQYLIIDKDGKILLFSALYDQKTEKQQYYLSKLDDSGKITDHIDVSKDLDNGQDTYISKIFADDKGNFIVITDQSVLVFDSNFSKTAEIKDDNTWIEAATLSKDGKVICGVSGEDGALVKELDVESKKFGEQIKIDLSYFNGSDALMTGRGSYDFFYKSESGIYGYNIKDKQSTKLLDFMASEINSNNTYGIIPIDEENMIGSGWNEEGTVFTLYKKVDPSQVKDKTTITYGAVWGIDDQIKNAAIKFNKENDKYRIEFKDYSTSGEEDAQTKMNADIIAGNVPDIIDLNYLPVEQYVEKGIIEDLTPYFEKDDTISIDDIVPAVEKAMEIDGKLYYLSSNFGVQSLIASKKDVGDKTGWTFDELKELLKEKGDDVRPFYSENKKDTMDAFLYTCVDDYIDWSTGKCRFDSDDFKSILEIANRGTDEETDYSEDAPSQPDLIKNGKILFTDGWVDTESVQVYKKMYNSDITFIGYPCEDKQGSYFNLGNKVGIYSKSDVKDGAWEFIRTLVTKDYQAKDGYMWNNPTNKDAFEMYMKTKTTTETYKDEYGNEISPIDSSWGWDDLEIKTGPLSAEEEKMYRDLIDNTTKISADNSQVMTIIDEEAANYFNGQKGLDETADIIQNRVSTFVNENR